MSEFRRRLMTVKGISYQQVEYLESNGTQIILTDYIPNINTEVKADLQMVAPLNTSGYAVLFGVYEADTLFTYYINNDEDNVDYIYVWNNKDPSIGGRIVGIHASTITERTEVVIGSSSVTIFNTTKALQAKTTSNKIPIALFGCSRVSDMRAYGRFNLRIYSFDIYEAGELVRSYIPVRIGNIGYMYDKVSGQLFGNLGSGKFILGPDL